MQGNKICDDFTIAFFCQWDYNGEKQKRGKIHEDHRYPHPYLPGRDRPEGH